MFFLLKLKCILIEFTAIEGTRCERENESNIEHTLEEAIEATSECNFEIKLKKR